MHIRAPIRMPGAMPSASALLGTAAGPEILHEINSRVGATFIGNRYDAVDNAFMKNVVLPTRQATALGQHTAAVLINPDVIVPLDSIEKFKEIPSSMYLPILTYAPVKALLTKGCIDGWGIDADRLPEEDVYGRLIENGQVRDLLTQTLTSDDESITFEYNFCSADPDLSNDDLDAIETTRRTVDRILADTELDPTNIDSVRG